MIELFGLRAGYPGKTILHDLSLTFPSGELTVIAGPNGCGKSTLLKTICGILPPTAGEVRLDGVPFPALPHPARQIAYLPQHRPTPDITALRLVLHGRFPYLSFPRRYGKRDMELARAALERMGLSGAADTPVAALSGGMRQKVYLAMILAQDTPLVLLDEPTTYLDPAHQLQTMAHARALCADGKTVVMVLHDLPLALRQADRVAVLDGGRAACTGTPEEVFQSGLLDRVFGLSVRRVMTPGGWQYYYEAGQGGALLPRGHVL